MKRTKRARFVIGVVAGIVVGLVVWVVTHEWQVVPLATWDGLALTIILLVWRDLYAKTTEETAKVARRDDMGRTATDAVLIAASLASLAAVVLLLAHTHQSPFAVVFALISIIVSWATVHTLYMVKYAVMYYDDHDDGVDFSGKREPTFADFAYLAFTIGMTYQVSDTTFTSTRFRRTALKHALLSFLFGTAIIATSINFLASLG